MFMSIIDIYYCNTRIELEMTGAVVSAATGPRLPLTGLPAVLPHQWGEGLSTIVMSELQLAWPRSQ